MTLLFGSSPVWASRWLKPSGATRCTRYAGGPFPTSLLGMSFGSSFSVSPRVGFLLVPWVGSRWAGLRVSSGSTRSPRFWPWTSWDLPRYPWSPVHSSGLRFSLVRLNLRSWAGASGSPDAWPCSPFGHLGVTQSRPVTPRISLGYVPRKSPPGSLFQESS